MMDPYYRAVEKLLGRDSMLRSRSRISMEWTYDAIEHPDFDIPGVMAVSPTGRVLLIVEGEKEIVGPIIEKAQEQMETISA